MHPAAFNAFHLKLEDQQRRYEQTNAELHANLRKVRGGSASRAAGPATALGRDGADDRPMRLRRPMRTQTLNWAATKEAVVRSIKRRGVRA